LFHSSTIASQTVSPDAQGYPEFVSYKSKEFTVDRPDVFFAGNSFFASVPDSPIMLKAVEFAMRHKDQRSSSVHGVLSHTGPIALGEVVNEYIKV
jgi:hypothetical protein